jgi:predicted Fe-Mo cluster-binding NifX family protein
MRICVPVTDDGQVGGGFGRARRVALATVEGSLIEEFEEFDVRWDVLHDEAGEGRHHARIARFLKEHEVEGVVASHMGDPMRRMLQGLDMRVSLGASGDAKRAVLSAARPSA